MTRAGRANSIIGAIIVVFLVLALGYYFTGSQDTAQAPGAPAATDTAQTPAPAPAPGTDTTNTGSTNP
ncbi:hypothetical protein QTA58_13940 [Neorhizobium sp. CSC1952]|uniref:Dynamin n=1 Tax=Xaviernesmea oryzae TaxID=464029 RepID=A0A1X7D5S3_9HYPH|nr:MULTISPECIES: hypothetical protein [Rhizobium/Agrobacterium group]WJR65348.1 hypothetical protein QTA58_13940 [Rhizobium sp. CSC1952]SMF08910.1 hypothetical protein SAMN02982989_5035 [Xaviernesmea oryzae]